MEMASIFTGVAKAAYEHALAYCHERIQGGVPLIEHQLTKYRLFEMFRKLELSRSISRRATMYNFIIGAIEVVWPIGNPSIQTVHHQ
jgi:acyl-CoA dehydrogenase